MIGLITNALAKLAPYVLNALSKAPAFISNTFSKVGQVAGAVSRGIGKGKQVLAVAGAIPEISAKLQQANAKLKAKGINVSDIADKAEKIAGETGKFSSGVVDILK